MTTSRTRPVALAVATIALTTAAAALTSSAPAVAARDVTAPAAGSHRVVHTDPAGDVVSFRLQDGDETTTAAPQDTTTDIVRTVVDHRARRLLVTVELQRLSRSGLRYLVGGVRTSAGERYDLSVDYSRGSTDDAVSLMTTQGRPVRCPGLSWATDGARETVRAVVPRGCLGDPAWVRVWVGASSTGRSFVTGYADDSRALGLSGADADPVLGPRQPHA